ncbi:PREDICTED: uncharacterized protein LOC100641934 isoform X2 [Amphimedon queenslandica]|nr:PREDICTED: uncharacterized protein LOC100641934 isoform X2 [Amphimedon queenslandica]|eukprot:XP_019853385.1 PREDICTED: uncharacterized protein LOC100641934 isoform X2 [Amphimedon queenslandica]
MKYQLHPLTASPVNPTEEKPWSEFVEDIFDLLSLTNDSWGYLTKGIVNDDGTIHLFNEGLDVSINDMLKRRGLLHIEEGEDEDFTIQHRIQTNEEIVLTPSPCSSPPPLYIESPNYPLEMTSPQASTYMYMNTLKIPHSPRSASKVYIDGAHNEHVIWSSLEETPFNTSICKELQERGFRSPTSVQSNGWYYVWNGNDTILCSPHHSGKTLSYLLPLLSLSCKREKEEKNSYEPEIIVVADDSYKTWNITDQAKTILTWFDAAKRFRTSFLFATVESDAHIQILNGVDILVATPPALTRLVKREIIAFRSTRHLVLDDLCLFDKFPSEMNDLLSCCIAKGKQTKIPLQLVACSSTYSKNNFNNFLRYSKAPVTVMTDIIEVLAMKKVKMNVLFCEVDDVHKKLLSVLKASSQSGPNVICVSNENEAQKILQVFSLYSFQVNIWRKEDNTHSFRSVTVVLDSFLTELLSTGTIPLITHLISYSLPTNKSTFKRRLSILLPSLSSHSTPSLSILLTLQCFNQSHAILKFCERLQTEPPPQLVAMGTKRQNEIRRNNPLWGVCHQIKCYGNCRKADCIHVHSFEELSDIRPSKLSPALVPTDGVVKVLVKTVTSPCHLWVQIIDHTPLHRGQTPYRPPTLTLSQISMDLGFYYSEPNNRMLCGQPSVGDYLCLNSVSGTYYRALVLDFSQPLGLYFHHKEKAKVRLVDTGEECIVDVNQLYTLPLSFLETPPLVIEAFLCGLIPPDNDTDWPPPSVGTATDMLLGHTLTGGITFSLQSSIWLDPVEERLELLSMGVVTAIDRPERRFIKEGISLKNTDHINMLKNCLVDNSQDSQPYLLFRDMVTETPPNNSPELQVKLTAIESLNHFYIQLSSAENNLKDISDRLNSNTPCQSLLRSLCSVPPVEVGVVCAAKFPFDDKWYRGVVMEKRYEERDVERGEGRGSVYEYLCFFADYGDCEWVSEKSVQPIDRTLLQLPFQAICCSLNNPEGIEFNEDAHEDMWELINSQLIRMKIVDSDPSFCSPPFPTTISYSVDLKTDDGSTVASLLLTDQDASCQPHELPGSELSIFLNLLLFNEGELVSSFLPFVISKRAQIELTGDNCEMLAKCVNEINSSEVINGLSLIASSNHNSAVVMADDCDLCEALLNRLKRSSKTQIPSLKLLFTLFLSSRFISLSYGELQAALCHLAFTERNGPIFSLCSDFLACLNTAKKIVMTEGQVGRFCIPDKERKPAHEPLRLVCSLLHTDEGCSTISQYIPHVLHCFKDYSEQLQESLLLSLLASSLFYPVLLTHHISALVSSLKLSVLSTLSQLLSFKDIAESLGLMIEAPLPMNGKCFLSSDYEEEEPKAVSVSRNIVKESPTNIIENLVPRVLWSQNRSQVILNVPLRGCSKHHVDMKEQTSYITASCNVEDKQYKFSLELFDNIDQVHSKQDGSGVIIKLTKSRLCYWPRLTSCKVRPSFVGVDHDRWKDSSSSDEEEMRTKQKSTSLLRDADVAYDSSECNSESGDQGEGSDSEPEFEDDDELLDFLPS